MRGIAQRLAYLLEIICWEFVSKILSFSENPPKLKHGRMFFAEAAVHAPTHQEERCFCLGSFEHQSAGRRKGKLQFPAHKRKLIFWKLEFLIPSYEKEVDFRRGSSNCQGGRGGFLQNMQLQVQTARKGEEVFFLESCSSKVQTAGSSRSYFFGRCSSMFPISSRSRCPIQRSSAVRRCICR